MIEIKDRNNYLEIIDSREIDNLKTSFYPKKDTFFNVFYLPVEEHEEFIVGEAIEGGAPKGGGEIGDPIEGGEADAGGGIGEPIEVAVPDPVVIGNIQIRRTGGTTVINVEDFVNENVLIDGKVEDFSKCITFLTVNTAV